MENEEKILTRRLVVELGLDKVKVITSDMIEGYTSIGNNAFNDCSSLTSIALSNSVTSIGYLAFDSCSSITSITIPNSIKSIKKFAFYDCKN